MRIEEKVWGERWLIREDSVHTTNILKLKAGYRCSWHRHQEKYNLFAVITGKVGIAHREPGETPSGQFIVTERILEPGDMLIIAPGYWHEFRVYEDGIMVEEMYVEYDDGDIEREKLGGPIDE